MAANEHGWTKFLIPGAQAEQWAIRGWESERKPGDQVMVYRKDGSGQMVELGEVLERDRNVTIFAIARDGNASAVTEEGVYEKDGDVYLVVTSGGGNLYAKSLTDLSPAAQDRLNLDDGTVRFKYAYARGAISKLEPSDRVSYERAKELSIQFGVCIRCGAKLEAKKSVEEGIGPVCRGKLGG